MSFLELSGLTKTYGPADDLSSKARPAVAGIDLHLAEGDILCLLGPSGCGKTTLLRLVAGLETPDEGRVVFDGRDVTGLPPQKRNFGLMFQEFALFPHKNVFDNVAFGLKMQGRSPAGIRQRTGEMLEVMGIADMAGRDTAALSGGERQRVALARALAPRPRLLMLDEPLGALDRALRERLLIDIRSILKELNMTAVFVTHDQSEALAVADAIAVMNAGRLEQVAPPEELYLRPATLFTAGFLGFGNLIPGRITAEGGVETALGTFRPPGAVQRPGSGVTLVLRPEAAGLLADDQPGDSTADSPTISGRVTSRLFTGRTFRLGMAVTDGPDLIFDLDNHTRPPDIGDPVRLVLDPGAMVVIGDGDSQ